MRSRCGGFAALPFGSRHSAAVVRCAHHGHSVARRERWNVIRHLASESAQTFATADIVAVGKLNTTPQRT
jgi:hypothetical protein